MPSEKIRMPISASSRNAPDWHCSGLAIVWVGVIALTLRVAFIVLMVVIVLLPWHSWAMASIVCCDTGVGAAKLGAGLIRGGDCGAKRPWVRDVRVCDVDLLDRQHVGAP